MTEEQKQSDLHRFVIVNMQTMEVVGNEAAQDAAKTEAEKLAADNEGTRFAVFQRVGSAKLEPKVVWRGAAS